MITQSDLDKAMANVQAWEQIVLKQFSEYQAKSGWFSGKAGEKSEYENAVKSRDAALANYNNLVAIFNSQAGTAVKAQFYNSQVDSATSSNTVYYLVAVVVAAVLGYFIYKKLKK